jgi:hypothetical protein
MLQRSRSTVSRSSLVLPIGAALVLALGSAAQAQVASPKVTITNTSTPIEIPLLQSSTVDIQANGDLRIQCRLDNTGACPSVGGPPPSTGGPATVTLTPSVTALQTNGAFSLSWTSSTGTEACYGAGPSGMATWTGVALSPSGNRAVTLATAGSYVFQIRCFNSGGSTTVSSATVTVTQAETPPPPPPADNYCSEFYDGTTRPVPTTPNFTAFGFIKTEKGLGELWGISAGQASTTRVGMPGFHLDPSAGRYLSIPFVMTDDTGSSMSQFTLDWIEANNTVGIPSGQITVTISPCAGDFRPPTGMSNAQDVYLTFQCRKNAPTNASNITVSSVAHLSGCPAPKGKQMYVNVATYNMYGATAPNTTTCSGFSTCGTSMIIQ